MQQPMKKKQENKGIREIRADYTSTSIQVYQAYKPEIARPALTAQKFVDPFSLNRMTWIKPSFLWLMERSQWGNKPGQECILAIQITRKGWEEALSNAVLTSPDLSLYGSTEEWKRQFDNAKVLLQWDPERALRGVRQNYFAIQVGISRHWIEKYVDEWVLSITDYTPLVKKIERYLKGGQEEKAKRLLPPEQIYPLNPEISRRIRASAHS
jgi:hypothetical protein